MHFFNPPRYLPLLELVASEQTSEGLLDRVEGFLIEHLGREVVRAKDRPNFIANRLGVFSALSVDHHGMSLGLGFDTLDALTGTLLDRPKTATYRTLDLVGLDTVAAVIGNMPLHANDPWISAYIKPPWLTDLIDRGFLGHKQGQGIYCKSEGKIL